MWSHLYKNKKMNYNQYVFIRNQTASIYKMMEELYTEEQQR